MKFCSLPEQVHRREEEFRSLILRDLIPFLSRFLSRFLSSILCLVKILDFLPGKPLPFEAFFGLIELHEIGLLV